MKRNKDTNLDAFESDIGITVDILNWLNSNIDHPVTKLLIEEVYPSESPVQKKKSNKNPKNVQFKEELSREDPILSFKYPRQEYRKSNILIDAYLDKRVISNPVFVDDYVTGFDIYDGFKFKRFNADMVLEPKIS